MDLYRLQIKQGRLKYTALVTVLSSLSSIFNDYISPKLKWTQCFLIYQLPLKMGQVFQSYTLDFCYPKDVFPTLVEIGTGVQDKNSKLRHFFCYFVIISPQKRVWPVFENDLNMLCAKFTWSISIISRRYRTINKYYTYTVKHVYNDVLGTSKFTSL